LKGDYQPKVVFGEGTIAPLHVSDSGEAADYTPLANLPAHAILIIAFTQ
jgi:hypothetical protein